MPESSAETIRMLASGSSGNSLFVRAAGVSILVDAGISLRRTTRALAEIGEDIAGLDAVIVTHEHSDHVRHLERVLRAAPDAGLYTTQGTLDAVSEKIERELPFHRIRAGRCFSIGQVDVWPFATLHDAAEPFGFRLEAYELRLGFATDLGNWTDDVVEHLRGCNTVVVEANHDTEMLHRGPYPGFLKKRIGGSRGHLSNQQARALVDRSMTDALETLILAHMSEKNNETLLAKDEIGRALQGHPAEIRVAAQSTPGPSLEVKRGGGVPWKGPVQPELF